MKSLQDKGICKLIGQKGLKTETETDDLNKKSDGKGINVMEIVDSADSSSSDESVEESLKA